MNNISKELSTILASEAFTNLANSKNLKIVEFDAIIALLIKVQIPFDVAYTPGTRRTAESAELSIFINPSTTLNFTINFQAGSSIFTGNTV
ncbi:MAG: hypothetical protein K0S75_703 [Clostridia bacterium]|jgi:hypothetical protein|nr:hypothetical protein [Clostridia bacterium]